MDELLYCTVCQVKLSDPAASEAHYKGKRHRKAVAKASSCHVIVPKVEETEEEIRKRKKEKALRKRLAKTEKIRASNREMAEEAKAISGPTMKDLESNALRLKLEKMNLQVYPIPSDGHCLYSSVGHQLKLLGKISSLQEMYCYSFDTSAVSITSTSSRIQPHYHLLLRELCSKELSEHKVEYFPFLTDIESDEDYENYCNRVKSSSDWGGQIELRALSNIIAAKINVHDADSDIIVIGTEFSDCCLNITYHRSYCSSGEHYNSTTSIV